MSIQQLLKLTLENKASDLHLIVGLPPTLRVEGELVPLVNLGKLTSETIIGYLQTIMSTKQWEKFNQEKELDFSYALPDQTRFRINAYFQKGTPAAAFRLIPATIPKIEDLNLPKICYQFVSWRQGFVLVTGPTGHGKSTTVAAILEEINRTQPVHIITIEDPIEYVLDPKQALISQREVGQDTLSWRRALRSCLREDPNVVFIGEMRDLETVSAALTIAETGHLVFSTLHTNSAAETIDRIVDIFPKEAKAMVRSQLANTLGAIISQRLIPTIEGKRVPAVEVLLTNPAVRNLIREGKIHQIDNVIATSAEAGMTLLEKSLADWVKKGVVERSTAFTFALRPKELNRLLGRKP